MQSSPCLQRLKKGLRLRDGMASGSLGKVEPVWTFCVLGSAWVGLGKRRQARDHEPGVADQQSECGLGQRVCPKGFTAVLGLGQLEPSWPPCFLLMCYKPRRGNWLLSFLLCGIKGVSPSRSPNSSRACLSALAPLYWLGPACVGLASVFGIRVRFLKRRSHIKGMAVLPHLPWQHYAQILGVEGQGWLLVGCWGK